MRFDVVHRGSITYTRKARSTAAERDEHGSLAGGQGGCRCDRCHSAFRRYHRRRYATVQVLRGNPINRRVPITRAAEQLEVLHAAGWRTGKIAAEAGCSPATIMRITRQHRRGVRARCWLVVERSVLAIVP